MSFRVSADNPVLGENWTAVGICEVCKSHQTIFISGVYSSNLTFAKFATDCTQSVLDLSRILLEHSILCASVATRKDSLEESDPSQDD